MERHASASFCRHDLKAREGVAPFRQSCYTCLKISQINIRLGFSKTRRFSMMSRMGVVTTGVLLSMLSALGAGVDSDSIGSSEYGASHDELASLDQHADSACYLEETSVKENANPRPPPLHPPTQRSHPLPHRHAPHPLDPDPALPHPSLHAPAALLQPQTYPRMPPNRHIRSPFLVRAHHLPPRFRDFLQGAAAAGPDGSTTYALQRRQLLCR